MLTEKEKDKEDTVELLCKRGKQHFLQRFMGRELTDILTTFNVQVDLPFTEDSTEAKIEINGTT